MKTVLFDLGNTRLKHALLGLDGEPGESVAVAHDDGGQWLEGLPHGDVACIASVGAAARQAALLEALAARFTRLHRVRTPARLGRLRIGYPEPAQLGVDRFLALLAVVGNGPALVVGIGTATTCDLLDGDGLHRGGRIAPSPGLMRQALHARVPRLPESAGEYAEFADATAGALASGCEGAALGLIERSLGHAQRQLGECPVLWLHGGGAAALRSRLPAHQWMPDAVLRGLARWHALCIA